ncbi:MAG: hypothetical protein ACJ747_08680 [Gaiellaceae bacterium]
MIGVVFTGVVVVAVVVPGVVVSNVVALCEASAKLRGCAAKVTTESRLLTPYALVAARAVRATADVEPFAAAEVASADAEWSGRNPTRVCAVR